MRVGDYTLRFYPYLFLFVNTKVQRKSDICKFFILINVNQKKKSVLSSQTIQIRILT